MMQGIQTALLTRASRFLMVAGKASVSSLNLLDYEAFQLCKIAVQNWRGSIEDTVGQEQRRAQELRTTRICCTRDRVLSSA